MFSSNTNLKKLETELKTILLFVFFFVLFLSLQSQVNYFLGSDAYYHAIHSKLSFINQKLHYTEPWIKLHFFNYLPVDPYFIFHYIGGLFIYYFGLIFGFKVYGSLLSASVFTIFYWVLSKLKVKYKTVWTFLFFISSAYFIHRLLLIRSFSFSITLMLLGYYLLHKQKYILLLVLSALYTLYYSLFIFLIPLAFFFAFHKYWNKEKLDLKPILYVLGGVLLGLVIHPETLNYTSYLKTQLIDVFHLKAQGLSLPTGNEVNLGSIYVFLAKHFLTIILLILSSAAFLSFYKKSKQIRKLTPLFLFCYMWLLLSLLIPRGVEYLIPFTFLASALVFSYLDHENLSLEIKNKIATPVKKVLPVTMLLMLVVLAGLNSHIISNGIVTHNKNLRVKQFKQASNYIENNSEAKSTIFYSNWSYFPKLFFFNQHNTYLSGFSPLFAYKYNPSLYWTWYNTSLHGTPCNQQLPCFSNIKHNQDQLKYTFTKTLQTDVLFLSKKRDKELLKFIRRYKNDYKKVFENEKFIVYKVKK